MDTTKLKKFAQFARRTLMGQISAKLDSLLAPGAVARREHPEAMKKLEAAIARDGRGHVIERVAYTWFNRFSALRYMDVNDLNPVRVISPLSGQFQPEILAEAKAGNIDEDRVPEKIRAKVSALLEGRAPSPDAQAEAYRLLLVAICNDWHRVMPFLFERIDDYTELLLPEDLLSNASILAYTREAMTPQVCEDVEVLGWLYQFYISEKKDEVFAGLKKNVKITAENIPAATQLFTPHWIVRYLVENSLGRLWILNRPNSRLKEKMDYYIAPKGLEKDFLKIGKPEEIKVCDPACGSGHMLTYAFDLLYAIYEEEGYDAAEIPGHILANNLYGIEIDERAGALAAFALTMKAAGRRKRFLRYASRDGVEPNICVLENVSFSHDELVDYVKVVGRTLFTADLRETLEQFREAKNFGSLIVPKLKDVAELRRVIAEKQFENNLFLREVHERVLAVLRMADYLSLEYGVVVTNPPYMGSSGMNARLADFAKSNFPEGKSDLYSAFIQRCLQFLSDHGFSAMVTIQNWMFLSSFEALRVGIIAEHRITNLLQIGYNSFPEMNSKVVQAVAFIIQNDLPSGSGIYINLNDAPQSAEKEGIFFKKKEEEDFYRVSSDGFKEIPGSPIAYWIKKSAANAFRQGLVEDIGKTRRGLQTGEKERFIRCWHESPFSKTDFWSCGRGEALDTSKTWYRFNNGGPFRKWYGNLDLIVNWKNNGFDIKSTGKAIIPSEHLYFEPAVCWGRLTSGPESYRVHPGGVLPGDLSPCFYSNRNLDALAYFNSVVARYFMSIINPTLTNTVGDLAKIPAPEGAVGEDIAPTHRVKRLVEAHKLDWDAYETSWDFTALPLLSPDYRSETLEATYARLRANWQGMTDEMQRLEKENNCIFIEAYGLQDELTPEAPIEEITLICNPAYRYGVKGAEEDREIRLKADTIAEFLSYAVGCMFGRYSLDAPSLILANQGDTLADYVARVREPSFMPDDDNVIPVLDEDWFADDITDRFRRFLRVTFGEEHFQENLTFVEEALGKQIRRYFTRDFFNDHVKRYKKRPIYWLFSSPKGTFNALIYMHRYRPDTVSVVLNDYLREFRSKLEAYRRGQEALSISGDASPAQKTKALKEIEATARQIEELDTWERDVLFPLATQKIEIDLDDGVKVNYPKFGTALKPIKGLNDSDD